MNNKELLTQIGLTGKKADVYLASLRLGPSSVLALSKTAKIFRPALYKLLEELEDEGIFYTIISGNRKLYSAIEPQRLLDIVEQKKQLLAKHLPDLKLLVDQHSIKPTVEYYEGHDQLRALYHSVLSENPEKILTYFPSKYMAQLFGEETMVEVIQERINRGIFSKTIRMVEGEITFETEEERTEALREVKYISKNIAPTMGIIVANDTVDLYSPIEENYGMRIKSKSFALMMTQYFDSLWRLGKDK